MIKAALREQLPLALAQVAAALRQHGPAPMRQAADEQVVLFHGADVAPIHADGAAVNIVKAREQIDEGRLARAGRPDERGHRSGYSPGSSTAP